MTDKSASEAEAGKKTALIDAINNANDYKKLMLNIKTYLGQYSAGQAPTGGVLVLPQQPQPQYPLIEQIEEKFNQAWLSNKTLFFEEGFFGGMEEGAKQAIIGKLNMVLEKNKKQAYNLINEMFSSEESYNKSLQGLIDHSKGYEGFSKIPNADKNNALIIAFSIEKKEKESNKITELEINAFNNFLKAAKEIVAVQGKILALKESIINEGLVNIEALPRVMTILTPLIKELAKETTAAMSAQDTLSMSDIGEIIIKKTTITFNSIFIQPVQRLPRWRMLSEELLKTLPFDSLSKAAVQELIDQAKESSSMINKAQEVADQEKAFNALVKNLKGDKESKGLIIKSAIDELKKAIHKGELEEIESRLLSSVVLKLASNHPGFLTVTLGAPDENLTSQQVAQQLSDYINCGFDIKFESDAIAKQWVSKMKDMSGLTSSLLAIQFNPPSSLFDNKVFLKRIVTTCNNLNTLGFKVEVNSHKKSDLYEKLGELEGSDKSSFSNGPMVKAVPLFKSAVDAHEKRVAEAQAVAKLAEEAAAAAAEQVAAAQEKERAAAATEVAAQAAAAEQKAERERAEAAQAAAAAAEQVAAVLAEEEEEEAKARQEAEKAEQEKTAAAVAQAARAEQEKAAEAEPDAEVKAQTEREENAALDEFGFPRVPNTESKKTENGEEPSLEELEARLAPQPGAAASEAPKAALANTEPVKKTAYEESKERKLKNVVDADTYPTLIEEIKKYLREVLTPPPVLFPPPVFESIEPVEEKPDVDQIIKGIMTEIEKKWTSVAENKDVEITSGIFNNALGENESIQIITKLIEIMNIKKDILDLNSKGLGTYAYVRNLEKDKAQVFYKNYNLICIESHKDKTRLNEIQSADSYSKLAKKIEFYLDPILNPPPVFGSSVIEKSINNEHDSVIEAIKNIKENKPEDFQTVLDFLKNDKMVKNLILDKIDEIKGSKAVVAAEAEPDAEVASAATAAAGQAAQNPLILSKPKSFEAMEKDELVNKLNDYECKINKYKKTITKENEKNKEGFFSKFVPRKFEQRNDEAKAIEAALEYIKKSPGNIQNSIEMMKKVQAKIKSWRFPGSESRLQKLVGDIIKDLESLAPKEGNTNKPKQ